MIEKPMPETKYDAFLFLLRAHDRIWEDKTWPFNVRMESSGILWRASIRVVTECDSALTAKA